MAAFNVGFPGTSSKDWPYSSRTYWEGAGTLSIPSGESAKMCPWCSGTYTYIFHSGVCPKVSAIEYYPNGSVKRVEFKGVE